MNDAGYAVMSQIAGLDVSGMKALNTPVAALHGAFWKKPLLVRVDGRTYNRTRTRTRTRTRKFACG